MTLQIEFLMKRKLFNTFFDEGVNFKIDGANVEGGLATAGFPGMENKKKIKK